MGHIFNPVKPFAIYYKYCVAKTHTITY